MKKFLKLALALAIATQSCAVFAEEQVAPKTSTKTATIIGGSIAGLGLLTGASALVYKMTRPVATKKTGLSFGTKTGIALCISGVAIVIIGALWAKYTEKGKATVVTVKTGLETFKNYITDKTTKGKNSAIDKITKVKDCIKDTAVKGCYYVGNIFRKKAKNSKTSNELELKNLDARTAVTAQ